MKQHITKEQLWQLAFEQSVDKLKVLLEFITKKEIDRVDRIADVPVIIGDFGIEIAPLPTIGQMIEFLGDDLKVINNLHHFDIWKIAVWINKGGAPQFIEKKELADALWEVVKDKLNK